MDRNDRADLTENLFQDRFLQLDTAELLPILEGLLFVAGTEGLTDKQIARILELPESDVAYACDQLLQRENMQGSFLQVMRIAGTWQLVTHKRLAPYLQKLAMAPTPSSLSQAALETLAIIAYRQPITRIDIEDIRGVKSDRALGTLVARGLIEDVGRADGPGRPFLYGTTREFLDHFGLQTPRDLPPIEEEDNTDEGA